MHKGLVIDFNSVAAYLAHEDDKAQSAFLNAFAKELDAVCGTRMHAEMQMTMVAQHLSPRAKEHVKTLAYEEESK